MPGKTSFIPAIDTILNSAPSLIAVYNLQTGAYTYVNDTAEKILGFKKELFLQRGVAYISSLVHPDDLARIIAENEKALAIANKSKNKKKTDEKIVTFEYRIRHQNGSWRWLRTDGIIFDRDNKGNVLHIMNSSIDITEQKESAIQTHRTRELAEQRNIVLDKVSKLMMKSINHQIALGEIIQMLVPAIADYCRLALIDEHKEIKELAVTHKDPDKVTLTQNLFDTYIGNPNTTHGVQKILQTGKAELISHVDDKILKTVKNDPALVKIVKSLNLQSYMGVPLTVRGTVIGALTLSSAREERIYKKDDMLFAEELARRIALMLDNGRLYREALDEIEKRKEAEAVIREREEQYRRLIELSPMPIAIHSMGKLLYINEAAVRLIGAKNKEAVLGKSILQFVHPDYHELVKKRAEIIYSNKKPNTDIVEEKFVTIQGDTIYVEVASLLFHYEGKPAIQVLIRDITVQKEVEEELRRREERFRLLVQNSSDLINVFSKDGTILYQSPSVKKILGREPRDRVGQSIFDNSHIHPADVKQRKEMLARTFAKPKEMVRAEFRVRHANGSWRTIEAVCQNFLDDPRIGGIIGNYRDITERKAVEELAENERKKILTILASTNEGIYGVDADGMCTFINPALLKLLGYKEKDCLGKSLHVLTHNRHLDGSEYKLTDCPVYRAVTSGNPVRLAEDVLWTKNNEPVYVLLSCSPMKEDRIITGGVITVIDIRERKKLERQKDEFIGIASHELKTPVTSIKAYAQVLENRFTKAGDERSASLLAKMDTQLNKLTNLIKDLLDVTKIETGELQLREETFDFNTLVSEIVEEMQRTTEKHKIVKKLGQTKNVRGDRDRIGQVLINFLSNAIKYSPDSDTIQVKTTSDTKSISAAVTDYGLGIDKTDQLKIFERFFRGSTQEKASYPGLGLGLYISAEIVRRHKGKIWVQSTKSQGATFSFSLPIK